MSIPAKQPKPKKCRVAACGADENKLIQQSLTRLQLWDNWLQPLSDDNPVGEDPVRNPLQIPDRVLSVGLAGSIGRDWSCRGVCQ